MYRSLLFSLIILSSFQITGQSNKISGKIIDQATSLGVPFATVQVKGTEKGTTSDVDGKFSIEAEKDQLLVIKMVGYVNQEVLVEGSGNFEFFLKKDLLNQMQLLHLEVLLK